MVAVLVAVWVLVSAVPHRHGLMWVVVEGDYQDAGTSSVVPPYRRHGHTIILSTRQRRLPVCIRLTLPR